MRFNNILRAISNPRIEALRNTLKFSLQEAPTYLNTIKETNKQLIYNKMNSFNNWYTKLIGLDEVKRFQDRVITLQDQLLVTQEKRRETGKELNLIRQRSNELQDEINKVKRHESLDRYLELMKQEGEILKLESTILKTFQDYDQMERELFGAFTNAIRDSHEKQRAQLEYTKYFGLVLSITGSFLAFCYSTLKKQDLKNYVEERLASLDHSIDPVLDAVTQNEKILMEVLRKQRTIVNSEPQFVNSEIVKNEFSKMAVSDVTFLKAAGYLLLAYIVIRAIS